MFAQMTNGLDFQSKALVLRAERQRVIASNIANADTPGYAARDVNFKEAMTQALGKGNQAAASTGLTHKLHIPMQAGSGSLGSAGNSLAYTVQTQPSADSNSVDLDRERANFVDNSVRYEATIRFINGHAKTILSAIQGQ
jgi:flagellar basal-body rod protein FlgB